MERSQPPRVHSSFAELDTAIDQGVNAQFADRNSGIDRSKGEEVVAHLIKQRLHAILRDTPLLKAMVSLPGKEYNDDTLSDAIRLLTRGPTGAGGDADMAREANPDVFPEASLSLDYHVRRHEATLWENFTGTWFETNRDLTLVQLLVQITHDWDSAAAIATTINN